MTSRVPPSMLDVADAAGVSAATVSRALRGLPGVSRRTRERVLEAADELAYVVSPEASGLSRRATGRVAVVVPRLDSWFTATTLSTIQGELRAAGLDTLVYQVDDEAQRSEFFRELPSRRKSDAIILVALPLTAQEEDRIDLIGVHVVISGGQVRDYPHAAVDDAETAVVAVEHLIGLGHRRIAMIRTSDTDGALWSSDVLRRRGYTETLARHGLTMPEGYLATQQYGTRAGFLAMEELLALPEPPTAVFCFSDEIAVAARHCAVQRGLRVPQDISIIGVDGHPLTELFGMSTVCQNLVLQTRTAARMALQLVRDGGLAQPHVTIPTRLVVRDSTAPPPPG